MSCCVKVTSLIVLSSGVEVVSFVSFLSCFWRKKYKRIITSYYGHQFILWCLSFPFHLCFFSHSFSSVLFCSFISCWFQELSLTWTLISRLISGEFMVEIQDMECFNVKEALEGGNGCHHNHHKCRVIYTWNISRVSIARITVQLLWMSRGRRGIPMLFIWKDSGEKHATLCVGRDDNNNGRMTESLLDYVSFRYQLVLVWEHFYFSFSLCYNFRLTPF